MDIQSLVDIPEGDLGAPSASTNAGSVRGRSKHFEEYDELDDSPVVSPQPEPKPAPTNNEAKALLEEQAKALQSSLIALLERVDKVKEEHEKLEAENRFLQEYIGSLMATSKITGTTPSSNRNSRSGMGRVK